MLVLTTSASGLLLPVDDIGPMHIVGVVALFVLALTIRGYYIGHQHGFWKATLRIGVVVGTYLLCLVTMTEAFRRAPVLKGLAPTPKSADFLVAQALLLFACLVICLFCVRPPAAHRAHSLR